MPDASKRADSAARPGSPVKGGGQGEATAKPSKDFIRLWLGQVISVAGSGMTGFALGVLVFQQTGSATLFAMITVCTTLPGILIAPFAGVVADRHSRRMVMILADSGSALATLSVAFLIWLGQLELWHIYVAMSFSSICSGIQVPAYQAAVTQLVPKQFYAQASGMLQMGRGMQYILSPVLAGLLIGPIGIHGVMLIDFATFLCALVALLIIKIPSVVAEGKERPGFFEQLVAGIRYLLARPGLFGLAGVAAVGNFMVGFLIVLVAPMILSFTSATTLGIMNSVAAGGMMVGSIVVSVRGAPGKLVPGMFGFMLLGGIGIAFMGVWEHPVPITAACFVFFLAMPFVNACQETIWRKKVEYAMQGRMFSLLRMIITSATVVAYVIAGPLADRVFEPLMAPGGRLAGSVGQVIGVGPGRGIAVLFILAGLAILGICAIGYAIPRVRRVDEELPDVTGDDVEPADIGEGMAMAL